MPPTPLLNLHRHCLHSLALSHKHRFFTKRHTDAFEQIFIFLEPIYNIQHVERPSPFKDIALANSRTSNKAETFFHSTKSTPTSSSSLFRSGRFLNRIIALDRWPKLINPIQRIRSGALPEVGGRLDAVIHPF